VLCVVFSYFVYVYQADVFFVASYLYSALLDFVPCALLVIITFSYLIKDVCILAM